MRTPVVPAGPRGPTGTGDLSSGETLCRSTRERVFHLLDGDRPPHLPPGNRLNPTMRVCLMVEGQEGVEWPQWLALAEAAEAAGLEGLFRSHHYQAIGTGSPAGSLDAWTTLAGLAARTSRLRLGTMVSPVTFRPASVLAKSVTTVDHVSDGRAQPAMGGGWFGAGHETYGFDFMTTRERLDELDRQLEEIVRQWTAAEGVWPKPVQ